MNFPIGVYSRKHKSWADIPDGAKVSIPNDPTNGGRALLLLRDKGAIKLKDGVGFKPTVVDITDNPKKLKFIEVDAAQAPRALDDVDAAVINTNYATQAGLDPVKDPILREDPKGPYVNLIAVRSADKDKPWVKILVDSYHTPEIKEFVLTKFKGAVFAELVIADSTAEERQMRIVMTVIAAAALLTGAARAEDHPCRRHGRAACRSPGRGEEGGGRPRARHQGGRVH